MPLMAGREKSAMKNKTLRLWLIASILLAANACYRSEPHPLRIGTNVWPGYEPLWLARDLSYYADDMVRPVAFPSATAVMDAFRQGEIEAAALTLDEALTMAQFERDFTIVLVVDVSNGADVLLAKPEIKTLKDLKGRRIAVETTAVGAYMLGRALEKANLREQDVKIVNINVNQHEEAFAQDKVDAVVTFEPVRTRLLRRGARVLFDSTLIPGEIVDIVVVKNEQLQNHADNAALLIEGWFKAVDYKKKNPEDAAERMLPRLKMGIKEIITSYEGLHLPSREENRKFLVGEPPEILKTCSKVEEVMIKKNLLYKRTEYGALLDQALLKRLYPVERT